MMNLFEINQTDISNEVYFTKLNYKQLLNHYFAKKEIDVLHFSDIKKDKREDLAKFLPNCLSLKEKQISKIDGTIKYLWELNDGLVIESVLMFYDKRATLCISSQVGCKMACSFCATGKLGLRRNLSVYEILEQVRHALIEIEDSGLVLNIVFMGMGEPTDNFDNINDVLWYLTKKNPFGFGLPSKNITVSTVGNIEGIEKFSKIDIGFGLALSLHSSNDIVRSSLIPINKKYDINAVLDSLYNYYDVKKVRVSIEYAMIRDVNDSEKDAYTLAKLLNRRGSNWVLVNLIELNEIDDSEFLPSKTHTVEKFVSILKQKGIMVTIRRSKGQDIDGACGQLAGNDKSLSQEEVDFD